MPRLRATAPNGANGKARELLEGVRAKFGMVPNIVRTMAGAPAVLEAYLGLTTALAQGRLSPRLREQIALAVAELNHCAYCLAAHTALGKAAGLSEETVRDSRRGCSPDSKVDVALHLARQIVEKRGWVTDADLARARRAGLDDEEIIEVVANVAANIFTNYFNHVAETEVDFPPVSEPGPA